MNSLKKLFSDTHVSSIIHDNDAKQVVITLLNSKGSYCIYKIFYYALSDRMSNIHIKGFTYNDFINFFINKAKEEGCR